MHDFIKLACSDVISASTFGSTSLRTKYGSIRFFLGGGRWLRNVLTYFFPLFNLQKSVYHYLNRYARTTVTSSLIPWRCLLRSLFWRSKQIIRCNAPYSRDALVFLAFFARFTPSLIFIEEVLVLEINGEFGWFCFVFSTNKKLVWKFLFCALRTSRAAGWLHDDWVSLKMRLTCCFLNSSLIIFRVMEIKYFRSLPSFLLFALHAWAQKAELQQVSSKNERYFASHVSCKEKFRFKYFSCSLRSFSDQLWKIIFRSSYSQVAAKEAKYVVCASPFLHILHAVFIDGVTIINGNRQIGNSTCTHAYSGQ